MSGIFGDSISDGPTSYDATQDQNLTTSITEITNIIAGSDVNLIPIIARVDAVEFVNDSQTNSINSIEALNTIQTTQITTLNSQIENLTDVEIPRINNEFVQVFNAIDTTNNNLTTNYRTLSQNNALYYPLISNPSNYLTNTNLSNYVTNTQLNDELDSRNYIDDLSNYYNKTETDNLINPKLDTSVFNSTITSINNSISSINIVNTNQDNSINLLDSRIDILEIPKPFQNATQTPITAIPAVTATNTQEALENLKTQIDNISVSGSGFNTQISDFINGMNTNYLTNTLIYNVFNTPILRAKFWSDISSITQRLGSNNTVSFGGIFANLGNSTGNRTFRIRGNYFNENNDTDILRVDQLGDFVSERRDGLAQPVYKIWEITNAGRNIRFNTEATIGVYNGIGQASSKSISDLILENQDSFIYLRDNIKNNTFITTLNQELSTTSNVQFNIGIIKALYAETLYVETDTDFDTPYFIFRTPSETRFDISGEGRIRQYGINRNNNAIPSFDVDTFGNVTSQGNINSNQIISNFYIDKASGFVRPHYYDFSQNLFHLQPQEAVGVNKNELRNQFTGEIATNNEFRNFQIIGNNNVYRSTFQSSFSDGGNGSLLYGSDNTIANMSLRSVLIGNKNLINKIAYDTPGLGVLGTESQFICIGMLNSIVENTQAQRAKDVIIGNEIQHIHINNEVAPYYPVSIGNNLQTYGSQINIGNFNKLDGNQNGIGFVTCIGTNWGINKYSDVSNTSPNNTILLGNADSTGGVNVALGGLIMPTTSNDSVDVQISLTRGPSGSGYGAFCLVRPFSSIRYKENVKPKTFDIDNFMKLEPVEYTNKNGDGKIQYGMIAENVDKLYPEFVAHNDKGECETIHYAKMVSLLVSIIQQQENRMSILEKKLTELEKN